MTRYAFLFNGCIVSGWPLAEDTHPGEWEANYDVGKMGSFSGVTHWVEFPIRLIEMEQNKKAPRQNVICAGADGICLFCSIGDDLDEDDECPFDGQKTDEGCPGFACVEQCRECPSDCEFYADNPESARGWIAMAEQLPESHKEVLFYTVGGAIETGRLCIYGDKKTLILGRISLNIEMVTHWSELPEPPKGSKEATK
jgi:hypothetical protein